MSTSYTIGTGTTVGHELIITNADGTRFSITNLGVLNVTTTIAGSTLLYGVLAQPNLSDIFNSGTLLNTNTSAKAAVAFQYGGYILNNPGDTIGGPIGIYLTGAGRLNVNNKGSVFGAGGTLSGAGDAIRLLPTGGGSGEVNNYQNASISGASYGIFAGNNRQTVVNVGFVTGGIGGVFLTAGGYLHQPAKYGTISANYAVAINGATGTFINAGTVNGGKLGVGLGAGGTVSNQLSLDTGPAGTITGSKAVSIGGGPGTVINAGFINGKSAAGTAVTLAAGFTNRVEITPGASFTGTVDGGNTVGATSISTLELATGSSAGSIGGIGAKYTNFSTIAVDAGASWSLTGSNTIASGLPIGDAGTLTNTGLLQGGVALGAAAQFTNANTGTVTGTLGISGSGGLGTVVNSGLIANTSTSVTSNGVVLSAGGSVTNHAGGAITQAGFGDAVHIAGTIGAVTNQGSISGGFYGVVLEAGGGVTNSGTGDISALSGKGIKVSGGLVAIVNNQATVQASSDAVYTSGGSITNAAGAVISGGSDGVDVKTGVGTVINSGAIYSKPGTQGFPGGNGVGLYQGGSVTNQGTGSISGLFGVYITGASGAVVNASTITGFGFPAAVGLLAGGSVGNQAAGYLRGNFGISIAGGGGSVSNAGFVTGFTDGVVLSGGGYVSNTGTGAIYGGIAVTIAGGSGQVTNAAKLSGGSLGVALSSGGLVNNQTGGSIGGTGGVQITGGAGTVRNAATIAASTSTGLAVSLAAGFTNTVTIKPGATFVGTVNGGNTIGATSISTLELAAGTAIGAGVTAATLSGFGSKYVNFGSIAVDLNAYWALASGGTVPSGAVLTVNGSLTNNGVVLTTPTLPSVGAVLTNALSASITAGHDGVLATAALATVVNNGIIRGTAGVSYAVHFTDGGTVNNESKGTISAATAIYIGGAAATVMNTGQLLGADTHDFQVFLTGGGTIQNLGGTIDGGAGIYMRGGPGVVVNSGKIGAEVANPVALELSPGFADQLSIAPGAVFVGDVDGGNAIGGTSSSTLVMIAGTSAGSIGGIGAKYYNFTGFTVASGATWNLTGTNTIAIGGSLFVAGTAINQGSFQGRISVTGGGFLSNASGGSIAIPVLGVGGPGTVVNQGLIIPADTSQGTGGILMGAGGEVLNSGTGVVSGARYGVSMVSSGTGIVANGNAILATGSSIAGGNVYGVALSGGGTVLNFTNSVISAASAGYGVFVSQNTGSVTNQGLIIDTARAGFGVALAAGGTVTNEPGAAIVADNGVWLRGGPGTVSNYGAIVETAPVGFSVYLPVGFADRLVDHPTASFVGQVNGGNTIGATAISTLELGTGGQQGVLTGLGSSFANFASVVVDPAALWAFQGQNTLAAGAALLDQGSLALNGELTVDGTLTNAAVLLEVADTGNGRLVVENQGSLVSSGGPQSTSGLQITQTNGLSGDILVTGTKSLLSNAGRFLVGNSGVGSLEIEAGSTVVTAPFTGEDGLVVANIASASGSSVDVSGFGSTLQVGGSLVLGLGGTGGLSITGGANVSTDALDAGVSAAATGQITVSGTATSLTVGGAATVADDGSGVLSVLNGATFAAASLTIGSLGDSSGAVVVSGVGSVIQLSGALNVGTALGTGDLTIGPGAAVHASVIDLQGGVVLEGGLLDPTVFIENGGSTTGGFGTVSSQFILLEGTILSNGSKSGKETEVVQGTVVGGGTATINGTVSVNGPGILQIGTHDTIELTSAVLNAATTTFTDNLTPTGTYTVNNSVIDVVFQDTTGVLQLDDIAQFAGTVATWKAGDSFVIAGGTLSNIGVSNGNTVTFSDAGAGAAQGGVDSIIFGSGINAGAFNIVNGNTVQAVACFAAGTAIETERGPVPVEQISLGDRLATVGGTFEPVVWVGSRTVHCARHPAPEKVWPVRVRAGAFGARQPARDLFLSPDHAVLVNDVLVPVKMFMNGTSIAQVKLDRVTYFHVELPEHAVILAEGLTVESYLDTGDRANFHKAGDAIRLFPDFTARLAPETAAVWEAHGAAPLVLAGAALAAAKRAIMDVAAPRRCAPSGPVSQSRGRDVGHARQP